VLDIKGNELKELPEEICRCTALTKIDMSQNLVTMLPWELHKLEALATLDVERNPLVIPPRPEVAKGTKAMLKFLKDNEKLVLTHSLRPFHFVPTSTGQKEHPIGTRNEGKVEIGLNEPITFFFLNFFKKKQ